MFCRVPIFACVLAAPPLGMKNSSLFPLASSIQILQFPEKGAALLWGPLAPKPSWACQADSLACGGRRTMLGDGQPEGGGPLPLGASRDHTAFTGLPSPFLCPVCWRAGTALSAIYCVLAGGDSVGRGTWELCALRTFELEPRLPLAFPSSEKMVLLPDG